MLQWRDWSKSLSWSSLRAQPVQWTQVYHRHCFFVISLRRRVSRLFRRGARETGIVCLLLFLGRWAYIEVHAYGHGVWAWIEFSMVHLHYRI